MAGVALSDVTKRFGTVEAVSHVSLHVEEGEFFSLLGPSGCGKTTMLRMLAGFISPTAGSISIGGINVTELPPEKRDVGIVFQNYAIFPHMNVYDNIGFGLTTGARRERPRSSDTPRAQTSSGRVHERPPASSSNPPPAPFGKGSSRADSSG